MKPNLSVSSVKKLSIIVSLVLFLSACGPIGPMPGGKLSGSLQNMPLAWSELESEMIVQIETQVGIPQSYNIWAVTVNNKIYIAAAAGQSTKWVQSVLRNPRVVLKIGTKLYGLTAKKVDDDTERDFAYRRYDEKYDLSQFDQPNDDMWVFRLDRR